jgi:hypothetical protein
VALQLLCRSLIINLAYVDHVQVIPIVLLPCAVPKVDLNNAAIHT